jgi:hypothetical protein
LGQGNCIGLGKAEPIGTTSRFRDASSVSKTKSLTARRVELAFGREVRGGIGAADPGGETLLSVSDNQLKTIAKYRAILWSNCFAFPGQA